MKLCKDCVYFDRDRSVSGRAGLCTRIVKYTCPVTGALQFPTALSCREEESNYSLYGKPIYSKSACPDGMYFKQL